MISIREYIWPLKTNLSEMLGLQNYEDFVFGFDFWFLGFLGGGGLVGVILAVEEVSNHLSPS